MLTVLVKNHPGSGCVTGLGVPLLSVVGVPKMAVSGAWEIVEFRVAGIVESPDSRSATANANKWKGKERSSAVASSEFQ